MTKCVWTLNPIRCCSWEHTLKFTCCKKCSIMCTCASFPSHFSCLLLLKWRSSVGWLLPAEVNELHVLLIFSHLLLQRSIWSEVRERTQVKVSVLRAVLYPELAGCQTLSLGENSVISKSDCSQSTDFFFISLERILHGKDAFGAIHSIRVSLTAWNKFWTGKDDWHFQDRCFSFW